jgi:hypothetical protein
MWLAVSGLARSDEAWLREEASFRAEVQITEPPSSPEAGVIAVIPDGGLLPRPVPAPMVYGADGTLLPCDVLWHNPAEGLAVVFQPPASGNTVTLYFRGAAMRPTPRGAESLRPGLLVFTRESTSASLDQAQNIPPTLATGSDVSMGRVPVIGQRENTLGNDENYISYYTGWIKRSKAARVYFATISDEGSELRVDGKTLASWPGIHTRRDGARGQFGEWVELSAGLHRIEYFHFEKDGDQETQAAWRIPGETPGDLPVMIPAGAFLRSGQARLVRAAFRDGRPVATVAGNTRAVSYFWFGNLPVNLFHLDATLTEGNPPDTVYTWSPDPDRRVTGRSMDWLIEGGAPRDMTLTASNAKGTSRLTVPVLSYSPPPRANVNRPADRQAFRNALLTRCQASPPDKDPCARWSPDLWATLVGVSEPYRGYDLLLEVFSRAPASVKTLAPSERQFLQDILIGAMRIPGTNEVSKWLSRFEEEENDRGAKQHWKDEQFDYTLYDRQDIPAARALAADMPARAMNPAETAMANIRMGDVERAAGNIEAATRLYSAAQDRYRETTRSQMTLQSVQGSATREGKREGRHPPGKKRAEEPAEALRATSQSWKTFAVQEAAFLATVRNLIGKGFFFEARTVLRKWELEVPLCKLSGDYPLAEADYYIAAQHYARALAGLRIYRKGVDVSSSLPEAMGLEMDCLAQMKKEADARELAKDIVKRFPNHPIGERARKVLANGL